MKTWTKPLAALALVLVVASTSGCEAEELGSLLGIGDEPPPPPPPPKPRVRRPTPPPPDPKPAALMSAMHLRANLAFDMVRARGIAEVKEGRVKVALATFQSAKAMKPGDQSVQLWIDAINEAMRLKRNGAAGVPQKPTAGAGIDVGDGGAPILSPSALEPVAPRVLPSLDPRLVF